MHLLCYARGLNDLVFRHLYSQSLPDTSDNSHRARTQPSRCSIEISIMATLRTPHHATKDQGDILSSNHADSLSAEDDDKEFEDVTGAVPRKFRGTTADQRDMMVLGKTQVLRRNFKFVTMLGFASTVMASWEILLPLFSFVLIDGGTAGLFWGFIIIASGQMLVYASIAELSSMSPTAGGQYHWVSEFAPPSIQKGLSYTVGWLS